MSKGGSDKSRGGDEIVGAQSRKTDASGNSLLPLGGVRRWEGLSLDDLMSDGESGITRLLLDPAGPLSGLPGDGKGGSARWAMRAGSGVDAA
jgi:hypothetical protein